VLVLEALGHQILDAQLKRPRGRVPKDAGRRRIPEDYTLGLRIRNDDSIPDLLEKFAETQVFWSHGFTPS
jgi:hypothetical protein